MNTATRPTDRSEMSGAEEMKRVRREIEDIRKSALHEAKVWNKLKIQSAPDRKHKGSPLLAGVFGFTFVSLLLLLLEHFLNVLFSRR